MIDVLVTGGAGFIGSNFVRHALDAHPDWRVTTLDKLTYAGRIETLADVMDHPRHAFVRGDIADEVVAAPLVQRSHVVVHFAAETHVDRSIASAGDFIKTDVIGTFVLLEAARNAPHLRRFVQISTDEVYGSVPEGASRETDEIKPRNPYSASKAGADRLAYSYFATYGVPVIITRASNNYGPYQFPEKIIPLFVTNAIDERPLPLYGDGLNVRDWLHVIDHCRAVDLLIEKGVNGEVYNVGGGNEIQQRRSHAPHPRAHRAAADADPAGEGSARPRSPLRARHVQGARARLDAAGGRSTRACARPSSGTGRTRHGGGRSRSRTRRSAPTTRRSTARRGPDRGRHSGWSPAPRGSPAVTWSNCSQRGAPRSSPGRTARPTASPSAPRRPGAPWTCSIARPSTGRWRTRGRTSSTTAPASRSPEARGTASARPSRSTCAAPPTCWPRSSATPPGARVLVTSSALVYRHADTPLDETQPSVRPGRTPSASSRRTCSPAAPPGAASTSSSRARSTTSARASPPTSSRRSVARQIALIEARKGAAGAAGRQPQRPARLHRRARCRARVRRAWRGRAQRGDCFNVCSGRAVPIARPGATAWSPGAASRFGVVVDPARFRPVDVPVVVGICRAAGGRDRLAPEIPLDRTLDDLLDWWRAARALPDLPLKPSLRRLTRRAAARTIGERKAKHGPAWPVSARLAQADDARHRRRRAVGGIAGAAGPRPARRITPPTRKCSAARR